MRRVRISLSPVRRVGVRTGRMPRMRRVPRRNGPGRRSAVLVMIPPIRPARGQEGRNGDHADN